MASNKRRRHTPDQIIRELAEGNKLLGSGQELDEVCRHLEIAESFGGSGGASAISLFLWPLAALPADCIAGQLNPILDTDESRSPAPFFDRCVKQI